MSKIKFFLHIAVSLLFYASCTAMIVDNRYFPLFPKTYTRTPEKLSRFMTELFFMTSDRGHGDKEEDVGLPEIWGKYDQTKLSRAMIAVGLPSPLLDEWRNFDIKWKMEGKLQAQGIAFTYDQALGCHWSLGGSWLFMRVHSWHEFFFDSVDSHITLAAPDLVELDEIRRAMNSILGLAAPCSLQSGFGDVDLHLRYGGMREYAYTCRRIDLGLTLGALIPTGVKRDQNNPASVPFGGDGFWGGYVQGDGEFELKEDLIAGITLRLSKRQARDRMMRMPLLLSTEHEYTIENSALYGVLYTPMHINPGATVMISPYVVFENVRGGFGAGVRYTLTVHDSDDFRDLRPYTEREPAVTQVTLEQKTEWAADYVSLAIFYNHETIEITDDLALEIQLVWDIPALLTKAYNISKTHKISLDVGLYF